MVLRCPGQRNLTKHHPIWEQLGRNWAVGDPTAFDACTLPRRLPRPNAESTLHRLAKTSATSRGNRGRSDFVEFSVVWIPAQRRAVLYASHCRSPAKDLEASTSTTRRNPTGPFEQGSGKTESRIQLAAVRSLRPPDPPSATGPASLRAAERTFRSASDRASRLRSPVRTRPNRADLPGHSCRPATKPNDPFQEWFGNARHLRNAQGRQRISKAGW